jgi:aryl-alcohol dehydrogenase-like predicted oxidoreductase
MESKELGNTGLKVSRIGFGCWAIGGHGYGKVDDKESIDTIREAVDCGVNFFDTANVYGFGHSEEILGKALRGKVNDVVIATKFGLDWGLDGKIYKDCSPKAIIKSLEGSLKRLEIDSIPLYQIHWHDNKTPIASIMETLEKCKAQGKIKHIGCSNFSYELILEAFNKSRLESLQVPYSIVQLNHENDIIRCVKKFNIGIVAYNVLGRGLLSGKFNVGSTFGEDDTRSNDENFIGQKFKRNLKIAEELSGIGSTYGKTGSQIAIRWVLDNPAITSAIIGIKNKSQLMENIGAVDWNLSGKDYERIKCFANR